MKEQPSGKPAKKPKTSHQPRIGAWKKRFHRKRPWTSDDFQSVGLSLCFHLVVLGILAFLIQSVAAMPDAAIGTIGLELGDPSPKTEQPRLEEIVVMKKEKEKPNPPKPPPPVKSPEVETVRTPDIAEPDSGAGAGAEESDSTLDTIAFRRRIAGGQGEGDIVASAIWFCVADVDLHIVDPNNERIYFRHRKSRFGGFLDVDRNAHAPYTKKPIENCFWPKDKAPIGFYRVEMALYARNRVVARIPFKVSVQVKGKTRIFDGRFEPGLTRNSSYGRLQIVCLFELKSDGTVSWMSPEEYEHQRIALAAKQRIDERNATAQVRHGIIQYRRGAVLDARATFQNVVQKWPKTTAAKHAAVYARQCQAVLEARRRRRAMR